MKKIIGLCGRSGSGKTTVSNILAEMGVFVINTDKIARDIVEPGKEALAEIAAYFGDDIIRNDGSLDRKELFDRSMVSGEKQSVLNRITHKYILNEVEDLITNTEEELIAVDAPLLFESGFDKRCDVTVGIISDDEASICRIVKRDKLSREKAELRLSRMKTNDFFIKNCDYIIYNDGSTLKLSEDVKTVINKINGR